MSVHAKRFALLIISFGVIAVSLVACQTPNSAANNSNTILIPTPNSANLTPTPNFPPFTIGAWPSNASPELSDSITIYVSCRVQDQSMQGPSQPPPAGQTVIVNIGDPIGGSYSKRTGADGYAAVDVSFNDPNPGQPVLVFVSTTWKGVTYQAQTFFTPGPRAPSTPTAQPTQQGGGGGGGKGTPTPGGLPPVKP